MYLQGSTTPEIDSCRRLVWQRAGLAYNRLAPIHRRWLDREDFVQDGFLAAVRISVLPPEVKDVTGSLPKPWQPDGGAKFSTYLTIQLRNHFCRVYYTPLSQQKRIGHIVELDASLNDGSEASFELEGGLTVPVLDYGIEHDKEAAENIPDLYYLCNTLSASAVVVLAKLFAGVNILSGRRSKKEELAIRELKEVQTLTGIGYGTLLPMLQSKKYRKIALTLLSESATIETGGTEADVRVLECIECTGQFSLRDVKSGRYVVDTMTCHVCYRKLQNLPVTESCFGKIKTPKHEGYSEADVECQVHCPDRAVCPEYAKKEKKMVTADDLEGVDLDGITPATPKSKKPKATATATKSTKTAKSTKASAKEPAKKVSKKTAAKSEKPAKAEKVAKPKKEKAPPVDDDPVPTKYAEQIGPRWPHKKDSMMRHCFKRCFEGTGVDKETLEKEVKAAGNKWSHMLAILRAGGTRPHHRKTQTHSWRLDESGAKLRVVQVKYLGEK